MSESHQLFTVRGRVQGVGFRWWTHHQAKSLGLRGSVRNLEDGSVQVFASGTDEQLKELEALLRQGPPSSHVTNVSVAPATAQDVSSFTIE